LWLTLQILTSIFLSNERYLIYRYHGYSYVVGYVECHYIKSV
jgi:hypothetical protein